VGPSCRARSEMTKTVLYERLKPMTYLYEYMNKSPM
jgi:hypothetical protein